MSDQFSKAVARAIDFFGALADNNRKDWFEPRKAKYRAEIATGRERVGATMSDWGPPPLKRVPKPYHSDHPHADLLKRKSFALHAPLDETWRAGILPALDAATDGLMPIWTRLEAGLT